MNILKNGLLLLAKDRNELVGGYHQLPKKPLKPCKHQGCPKLTEEKYCDEHKALHVRDKANANGCGYDSRWRTARNRFLKVNPLCVKCKE